MNYGLGVEQKGVLPSFNIQGLAAAERRRLNYESLYTAGDVTDVIL